MVTCKLLPDIGLCQTIRHKEGTDQDAPLDYDQGKADSEKARLDPDNCSSWDEDGFILVYEDIPAMEVFRRDCCSGVQPDDDVCNDRSNTDEIQDLSESLS